MLLVEFYSDPYCVDSDTFREINPTDDCNLALFCTEKCNKRLNENTCK